MIGSYYLPLKHDWTSLFLWQTVLVPAPAQAKSSRFHPLRVTQGAGTPFRMAQARFTHLLTSDQLSHIVLEYITC